jgi:GAF domain-containing protein/PAS domain-containing protein
MTVAPQGPEPSRDDPACISDEQQALLQFLYMCPVGMVEFVHDGTVVLLNPAVVRMVSAIDSAAPYTNVFDMLRGVVPDLADFLSAAAPKAHVVLHDHRVPATVQGAACWLSLTIVRVNAQRFMLTITDVTRSAEIEHALAQREAELQSVFASIDEGLCVCQVIVDETGNAVDYRFDVVNPLFEEMSGLVDPVGRTARELVPELDAQWVNKFAKVALGGEKIRFEQGSDALGRWFDVFATPIGTAGRFAIVFKDQTAKRSADRSLQRAARFDAFRAELVDSMRDVAEPATLKATSAELLGRLLDAPHVHFAEVAATSIQHVALGHSARFDIGAMAIPRLADLAIDEVNSLRNGVIVRVDDPGIDTPLKGARAIAPVVRGGRLVATLTVHRPGPYGWRNDDVALIAEVAERTWVALDAARTEASRRRRHERSNLVAQLLADLELDDSLEAQTQRCCDTLTGTFCDFATIEIPLTVEPVVALAHVDSAMLSALRSLRRDHRVHTQASDSIANARADESVLLKQINRPTRHEYNDTPEASTLLEQLGPRSQMTVRLPVGSGAMGALMVGISRPDRASFDVDDFDFLRATAERIGVVLAASQLRRQEHAISHRLQRALLPDALVETPHFEVIARYRAASTFMEVGGDWYDSFSWPSGHIGFIVGDVVGHNLESAATMGQLRAGLAALAASLDPTPGVLLDALAQCARGPGGSDFVTAACVIVDTATGELTYSRAGHPPPFVVSSDGRVTVLDGALAPPLCHIDVASRPEATMAMTPGATLVMYTDGLIERRRVHLDIGFDKLRSVLHTHHALPLDGLADHIIAAMTAASPADDDIVVLCTRYVPH